MIKKLLEKELKTYQEYQAAQTTANRLRAKWKNILEEVHKEVEGGL